MIADPESSRSEAPRERPLSVLVVDDDIGTLEIVGGALRGAGVHTVMAMTARAALEEATKHMFDVAVIDLKLPDMSGTDLISHLRARNTEEEIILVSGFMTVPTAVRALRLGVRDVMEKPIDVDALVQRVRALQTSVHDLRPARMIPRRAPRSNAERWALHVYNGFGAKGDLKTLLGWARQIGVSRSTLCECCHLVGIQPRDARDFTRMLRVVSQGVRYGCPPEVILDVSDRRTLRHLLDRSGIAVDQEHTLLSVEDFFRRQQFVPHDHDGLVVLKSLLAAAPSA